MKNPTPFQKILMRHAAMILDARRTNPLKRAIAQVVKKDDVVCDIGAGLGLLTFFALSAGARHVYAIDCDAESLNVAISYARKHDITDRISFIEAHSFDAEIGEKADVLICETIGSAAFDENILSTLADAKRRFLKKTGKVIPAAIELWAAPVTGRHLPNRGKMLQTTLIKPHELLCAPRRLIQIKTIGHLNTDLHLNHQFRTQKGGILSGLALWPKICWARGQTTDASPLKAATHWQQCFLPVSNRKIKRGAQIRIELIIRPDPVQAHWQTEVLWKIK